MWLAHFGELGFKLTQHLFVEALPKSIDRVTNLWDFFVFRSSEGGHWFVQGKELKACCAQGRHSTREATCSELVDCES